MNTICFRTTAEEYKNISLFEKFPNVSLKVLCDISDSVVDDIPYLEVPSHPVVELSAEWCGQVLDEVFDDDMMCGHWSYEECGSKRHILESLLAEDVYGDDGFKLLKLLNLMGYCELNELGLLWS